MEEKHNDYKGKRTFLLKEDETRNKLHPVVKTPKSRFLRWSLLS